MADPEEFEADYEDDLLGKILEEDDEYVDELAESVGAIVTPVKKPAPTGVDAKTRASTDPKKSNATANVKSEPRNTTHSKANGDRQEKDRPRDAATAREKPKEGSSSGDKDKDVSKPRDSAKEVGATLREKPKDSASKAKETAKAVEPAPKSKDASAPREKPKDSSVKPKETTAKATESAPKLKEASTPREKPKEVASGQSKPREALSARDQPKEVVIKAESAFSEDDRLKEKARERERIQRAREELDRERERLLEQEKALARELREEEEKKKEREKDREREREREREKERERERERERKERQQADLLSIQRQRSVPVPSQAVKRVHDAPRTDQRNEHRPSETPARSSVLSDLKSLSTASDSPNLTNAAALIDNEERYVPNYTARVAAALRPPPSREDEPSKRADPQALINTSERYIPLYSGGDSRRKRSRSPPSRIVIDRDNALRQKSTDRPSSPRLDAGAAAERRLSSNTSRDSEERARREAEEKERLKRDSEDRARRERERREVEEKEKREREKKEAAENERREKEKREAEEKERRDKERRENEDRERREKERREAEERERRERERREAEQQQRRDREERERWDKERERREPERRREFDGQRDGQRDRMSIGRDSRAPLEDNGTVQYDRGGREIGYRPPRDPALDRDGPRDRERRLSTRDEPYRQEIVGPDSYRPAPDAWSGARRSPFDDAAGYGRRREDPNDSSATKRRRVETDGRDGDSTGADGHRPFLYGPGVQSSFPMPGIHPPQSQVQNMYMRQSSGEAAFTSSQPSPYESRRPSRQ